MAGEKYVNNEYLEDKEFNLEGKKRFYTMPEGVIDSKMGQTRMQTIEREKGVSRSVIDNLFKRNQPEDTGPITLATSYYRVSQADTIQGLGQQCFSNKKMKKAKELDLAQDINLWPRAPCRTNLTRSRKTKITITKYSYTFICIQSTKSYILLAICGIFRQKWMCHGRRRWIQK
jgi:hypothetical protein